MMEHPCDAGEHLFVLTSKLFTAVLEQFNIDKRARTSTRRLSPCFSFLSGVSFQQVSISASRVLRTNPRTLVSPTNPLSAPLVIAHEAQICPCGLIVSTEKNMAINFVTFNQDYSHLAVGKASKPKPEKGHANQQVQQPREVSGSIRPSPSKNVAKRSMETSPCLRCCSLHPWSP